MTQRQQQLPALTTRQAYRIKVIAPCDHYGRHYGPSAGEYQSNVREWYGEQVRDADSILATQAGLSEEMRAATEIVVVARDSTTIIMRGHPPVRCYGDQIEELWLGHVDRDFGGRYLRAVRTKRGNLIVWLRYNSPSSDGDSHSTYLATLGPGDEAAGTTDDEESARAKAKVVAGRLGYDPADYNYGDVVAWLAELGYASVLDCMRGLSCHDGGWE